MCGALLAFLSLIWDYRHLFRAVSFGLLAYAMLTGDSLAELITVGVLGWIGFGSSHHTRELECDPAHPALAPAAHGFSKDPIG